MKKSYVCSAFLLLFASISITSEAHAGTASTIPKAVYSPIEVEKKVREYFKDTPQMIEIARCESKFRQFTDAGNVLRGGSGGGMIGVFQFYESIHAPAAQTLGFDLATLEGNLGYAKHVHKTQGTAPWNSAKYCWDVPFISQTATVAVSTERERLLKQIETLTKLITLLQKQLNTKSS
ncbi:MAG: hypothetical protein KBC62_01215 [Candidatus Pacebacteria bacterium]|nr:hypothetical protein [Candidatus Paceibacterota bacterium]MBP9842603.1 hypothetical protein [Candidatus Paceibacterota bacterium]